MSVTFSGSHSQTFDSLLLTPEATSTIAWQPSWLELDLVIGAAVDAAGTVTLLDPAAYATVPRDGVRLADVSVLGSPSGDRLFVGVGSTVDAAAGGDVLFNTDSRGGNRLVGGLDGDQFFLRAVDDAVIGGSLLADAAGFNLPPLTALVDRQRDVFLIDSSTPVPSASLRILDFELGVDALLVDGVAPSGSWPEIRQQLQALSVAINAAPQVAADGLSIVCSPGLQLSQDLAEGLSDPEGDALQLIKLQGPDWITVAGTVITTSAPADLSLEQLAAIQLTLAVSDGMALAAFDPPLVLQTPPSAVSLANAIESLPENSSTALRIKVADIVITDDASGEGTISLAGPDAANFEVEGTALYLTAGTILNYEARRSLSVRVVVADPTLPGSLPVSVAYSLPVTDVNEAPTQLLLANLLSELPATVSTVSRIKLADLSITDDALGLNQTRVTGVDAAFFEVENSVLFLKVGADLQRLAQSNLSIAIEVDDPGVGAQPDLTVPYTLAISDPPQQRNPGEVVVTVPLPGGGSSQVRVRFSGGDLPQGGSLQILQSLLPDAAGRQSLVQAKVTINSTGIDLDLEVAPGLDRASLHALLELVAADLLAGLRSADGRASNRFLALYSLDSAGAISPLTYDPLQQGGARFYDLSGDGVADFMSLTFVDGGYGDKDRVRNGQIDDPSFAGLVDLVPSLRRSSAAGAGLAGITVGDPDNATAPVALPLQARLQVQPGSANQIGYVVLDAAELATAEALLRDPAVLRSRAQLLFSSLESQDVVLPSGTQFSKDLLVRNGQSLHFFELIDAGLEEISGPADPRFRYLTPAELSTTSARFDSPAGIGFSIALRSTDQGLDALIGQEQHRAPLLDLTAFSPDQRVVGTVAIGREASLDSITGFYRTQDTSGAVRAGDGRTLVRPGEVGYAQAALRMENQVADLAGLSVADNGTASRSFQLTGGSYLAPFSQVGGSTFFAFAAANTDGIGHFRTLGSNTFGYEDLPGGGDRDFDDGVLSFRFDQVI